MTIEELRQYILGILDNSIGIRDEQRLMANTAKRVGGNLGDIMEVLRILFADYLDQSVKTDSDVQFQNILGKIITLTGGLMTDDFVAGMTGTGTGIVNKSEVHTDRGVFRKYIEVLALVVSKMYWRGGRQCLSPAGMKISKIEEFDDYWRCYMETEDGQTNEFTVGALARCNNYGNGTQKYYWRLVTGIGEDYIDLSKTDCDTGSGTPAIGDDVVQFGHKTDPYLQWIVMDSSFSDDAGRTIYANVNGYDLSRKMVLRIGVSPTDPSRIGFFTKHGEFSDVIEGIGQDIQDAQSSAEEAKRVAQEAQNFIDNTLPGELSEIRGIIDGQIESFFYDYDPTMSNYPASSWASPEDKERHLNDTFTNTTTGASWRFLKESNVYKWVEIADTVTKEALRLAGEAKDTADGKRRVFVVQPTPPYEIGDLWAQGGTGDLMRCVTERKTGNYIASEWGKASKYTDDTKASEALERMNKMADDGIITKEEKAALRDTLAQIKSEITTYQAQATQYGVSITALQNSYNTLNTFLTNTVKISQNVDTSLTVAQKTEYNQDFANYYSERTVFANLIAKKVADTAVDNVQIGGTNLARYSGREYTSPLGLYAADQARAVKETIDGRVCLKINNNSSNYVIRLLAVSIEEEDYYTFSIWMKGTTAHTIYITHFNGGSYGNSGLINITTEWTKVTVTFQAKTPNDIVHIYNCPEVTYISDWKYEKGNKGTDWTPHLLDQQAKAEEALARVSNMAKDNLLTREEKATARQDLKTLEKEYASLIATATSYGVAYTALTTAKNNLVSYLTGTAKINEDSDTTIVADTYAFHESAYKVEVSKISNVIAQKISDDVRIGSVNLISRKMMLDWNNKKEGIAAWGQDADGIYLKWDLAAMGSAGMAEGLSADLANAPDIFIGTYKPNTQYTISIEAKNWENRSGAVLYVYYTDGSYSAVGMGSSNLKTRNDLVTVKGKSVQKIVCYISSYNNVLVYNIGLIEGNKIPTEIPTAQADLAGQSNVNLLDNSKFQFGLEGYKPNQAVTLNIVNGVLQARSSQTTSTPGIKPPIVHLKPGVYTVKTRVKLVNMSRFVFYAWEEGASTHTAISGYIRVLSTFSDITFTFAIPSEGDYRVLMLWGAAEAAAYPCGIDIEYLMLTAGSIAPQDWNPSAGDVAKDIKQVSNAVTNLNTTINGAFKDGIVDKAETDLIKSNINTLNAEKKGIDAGYTTLYNNPYLLSGSTAAINLLATKNAYNTAHSNLINSINTAIADGKATPAEKADVDAKFTAYGAALASYEDKVEAANKAIQDTVRNNSVTDVTKDSKYYVGYMYTSNTHGVCLFKTTIPEKSAVMLRVDFEGLMYDKNSPFGASLVFYTYSTGLSNYGYTVTGTDMIAGIRLGVKDGKVAIEIKLKSDVYYPCFNITIMGVRAGLPVSYSQGWTFASQTLASGNLIDSTYANVVIVPIKSTAPEIMSKDSLAAQLGFANFEALKANAFKKGFVKAGLIEADVIDVNTLAANDAFIDKLRTNILTANTIKSNMIDSSSIFSMKMNVNNKFIVDENGVMSCFDAKLSGNLYLTPFHITNDNFFDVTTIITGGQIPLYKILFNKTGLNIQVDYNEELISLELPRELKYEGAEVNISYGATSDPRYTTLSVKYMSVNRNATPGLYQRVSVSVLPLECYKFKCIVSDAPSNYPYDLIDGKVVEWILIK